MEGKRMRLESQSQSEILLTKIKALLLDLTNGRSPLILINRFRTYCTLPNSNCFCGSDLPCGKEVLTLCKETHAHRLDVMLRVLLIVQKLLQENKHSSKRDIYYMHPSVFLGICREWVQDVITLNLGNCTLQLVMGWIRFFEGKRVYDCINSPNTAHPVPVLVEEVKDIVSVARYILVVEKESVFQRLANDQFCNANHCIVITGRGYPDIPTRRFLRLLVENLHLPAYCLVDCDPYGFDILTTYRFGSMQMAYDTKHLRVPEIQWLGAFPSDSERYLVPKQCLLPLTAEDKRKIKAMLLRCYLQREVPQWRLELKLMLQKGVKFEIEALSVHTLSFLSESYIPSKIQTKLVYLTGCICVFRVHLLLQYKLLVGWGMASSLAFWVGLGLVYDRWVCVLKINTQCKGCKVEVMQILQKIRGVYNITIDGEQGTVKVTGRVNPSTLLSVLEKCGKHAEIKYVKFDGEVVDRNPRYYGEYGQAPYAMEHSYPPLLSYPQHQWCQPSNHFPPPPLAPYPVAPPPAPIRPYGPPPLHLFVLHAHLFISPQERHQNKKW
ncbi:Topoisomerase 6 subunit A/Spo11, TOPRIM domain [Sesbania bispinosa]|nr:Topoisomerase 6 subunit A/Spo11, TOPRIM domain [Sesbania bispinosa]